MSSLRKAEIARQLNDWLHNGRYNAPNNFRGNEKAERLEAEALLGVLLKYAPQSEPTAFVSRVLDQLEYQLKVRVWPNKQEMGAVCVNLVKQMPKADRSDTAPTVDMRDIAINARRMERGEAVGEGYLWGRMAAEMIAEKLVDEATMTRYRSAAFFAHKDAYGDVAAREWEAEAKARHDAARQVWRHRNDPTDPRDTRPPSKSVSDDLSRAA